MRKSILRYLCVIIMLFISIKSGITQSVDFIADTVCFGDSTKLVAIYEISINEIDKIVWDLDNDGYYDNGSGDTVKYLFSLPGTNYVGLRIITTDNDFVDTNIQKVVVYPLPEPNYTIKNICQGNITVLTSTSVLNAPSGNYYWDIENNNSVDYTGNEFISYKFENTSEEVKLKITNTYNCSDSVVKNIQLFANPNANFSATEINCPGDSVTFTNQASCLIQDSAKYFWKFGDNNQSALINPTHVYKKYGEFTVSFIAVDENNCADTVEKTIIVPQKETVFITCDKDTLYEKESVILQASAGFETYEWTTGETTSSIVVSLTDSYSVIAYDNEGCISFDTVNIVAFANYNPDEIVAVNNIITPYNDGVNDNLEFYDLETYGKCKLSIFNQWGFQIIKIDNYQNDWNGTDEDGNFLNTGTYFYVIQSDKITSKGSINIIR